MQSIIELTENHCDIITRADKTVIHFKNGEMVLTDKGISFEWYDDYADVDVIDSVAYEKVSIVSSDDTTIIMHMDGEFYEFVFKR